MGNASLPTELLEILACPACDERPKIELRDGNIFCPKCGRVYPVESGVPIMLVSDAADEVKGD